MKNVVAVALAGSYGPAASAQESASNYEHLKPIESLIGQWKMAGQWDDGKEFVGEEHSAWMLNRNFIRSTGWFRNHDGERVDYHIVTGWDPKQKQMVQTFSLSDGGHSKRVRTYDEGSRAWKCKEAGVDGTGYPLSRLADRCNQ